jgi:hypothetical protein
MKTKTKSRAAGDSPYYTFELKGGRGTIELPSVTHIIKSVCNNGMGGMAYWGAKLGIEYMAEQAGGLDVDELYEAFRGSPLNPNAQRDKGGERGTGAHDLLQQLIEGTVQVETDQDLVILDDGLTTTVLEGYPAAAARVYLYLRDRYARIETEVPVWSLKNGFAGTADVVGYEEDDGHVFDVVDLKTHKPPVRFEDRVQPAAYGTALEEMRGDYCELSMIALAKPDGTFDLDARGSARGKDAFLAVKQVYDHMQAAA